MRSIVPDELIRPLKILGKYDWVRWKMSDKLPLTTSVELKLPADPELLKYPYIIDDIQQLFPRESFLLFELYAKSKALAEGPKLLCPTAEQCEALEHVDVNISFDDYAQPFPTFLLELPLDYRRKLEDRFQVECNKLLLMLPRCTNQVYLLVSHRRSRRYVVWFSHTAILEDRGRGTQV